jgi:hypothetical protein
MSASVEKDVMDFLSALGRRLQPATASDDGRSAQAALAEI